MVTLLFGLALDNGQLPTFANNYNRELAKNGLWSLFAAFRNNELDYSQFYSTMPIDDAFRIVHDEFAMHGAAPSSLTPRDTLRFVPAPRVGPELRPNVIQITVESLSADFVSSFNRASRLMPNLAALAQRAWFLNNSMRPAPAPIGGWRP